MTFTSFVFVAFFAVVYPLHLFLTGRHRLQNALLLAASLTFYGYWDWRFLFLMVAAASIDYFAARWIEASDDPRTRRRLLIVSMTSNLGVLGLFKYFNFFAQNLQELLALLGMPASAHTLNIVLPIGISFYTFQAMSYAIDVYRRELPAIRRFDDYLLFVVFFPQLVAGPIERATVLAPQVISPRRILPEQIEAAIPLILWGFFKKLVFADNVALIADEVFNGHLSHLGADTIIGALAFTIQIYCDFSAYSDIARGLSKLMGFELRLNFNQPYFAVNPSDFWRRWHISLSSWLRDYLYIPLGGNRRGKAGTYRNLMITMLLGGLWHGAAWNFIIWGAYHGAILVFYRLLDPRHEESARPGLPGIWWRMPLMFGFTIFGWLIFRARSATHLWQMFAGLGLAATPDTPRLLKGLLVCALPLTAIELLQFFRREHDHLVMTKLSPWSRIPVYAGLVIVLLLYGARKSSEFIYFQF